MKVSVIIPAYNAEATIQATLDSVIRQTVSPDEILVLDDGSTDDTALIVECHKSRVTLFRQSNQGVAHARNFLCEQARGDIIAFLDADDIWHPSYLEVQCRLIEDHPGAVAYFTEHENYYGYGNYRWNSCSVNRGVNPELIDPVSFIKRYNQTPMSFQMSCCCIPKKTLAKIGGKPFCISGAEDTYLHNLLPLLGHILYIPIPLVVYRILNMSLSTNRLKNSSLIIDAFDMLEKRYKKNNNPELYIAFKMAFASRRRQYGKFLMGANRIMDAQREFWDSIKIADNPVSITKSLVLFILTYMPHKLQPRWPRSYREWKGNKDETQ
jgi:glycosyltransferase involved in cell wall biosynthesis